MSLGSAAIAPLHKIQDEVALARGNLILQVINGRDSGTQIQPNSPPLQNGVHRFDVDTLSPNLKDTCVDDILSS